MASAQGVMQARRQPLIPDGVLGMIVFVIAEAMFFAGLISAFMIVRASSTMGWPPPGQPRLPAADTAVNTVALLISAALVFKAWHVWKRNPQAARNVMAWSMALGTAFVAMQGVEWVALVGEGLTLTSSSHGSFFYLIVGLHASHAVAALCGLFWVYVRMTRGTLTAEQFLTAQAFWYFVVGLWPFIYARVYF